jgi:lipopolysaccharide export LptBFGC system permease protein LptF
MQILARYLATTFFKNLLLSFLGLSALFFFQSVITRMNDYVLSQLIIYSLYDIPSMMVMVAPPCDPDCYGAYIFYFK